MKWKFAYFVYLKSCLNSGLMKKLGFTTWCLMLPILLSAQVVIKGGVYDKSNGDPLIGANIIIKGTSTGTTADFDGSFELKVDGIPVTWLSPIPVMSPWIWRSPKRWINSPSNWKKPAWRWPRWKCVVNGFLTSKSFSTDCGIHGFTGHQTDPCRQFLRWTGYAQRRGPDGSQSWIQDHQYPGI